MKKITDCSFFLLISHKIWPQHPPSKKNDHPEYPDNTNSKLLSLGPYLDCMCVHTAHIQSIYIQFMYSSHTVDRHTMYIQLPYSQSTYSVYTAHIQPIDIQCIYSSHTVDRQTGQTNREVVKPTRAPYRSNQRVRPVACSLDRAHPLAVEPVPVLVGVAGLVS